MSFMSINIDFSAILNSIINFFIRSAGAVILDIFVLFGWLFLFFLILEGGIALLKSYRQSIKNTHWQWILLAIDIPSHNIQTPKAVEQMFTHLAGSFNKPNLAEVFYYGYKQPWFSFEIVSIEGYIQFLVRIEKTFRDLVEASVYAQYPEAEITEIEDYSLMAPKHFPDEKYEVWATDFGLAEDDVIPIRMYREFEEYMFKDKTFKDPMGTFLESFSRIGAGEQMWFQIIIEPINNGWKNKALEKIKEVMTGKKVVKDGRIKSLDPIRYEGYKSWDELSAQLFATPRTEPHKKSETTTTYMTANQGRLVDKMEDKLSKVIFKTKIRGVYLAEKSVFNTSRGVKVLLGAINQFNSPSANSIVPKYGVGASYFFKQQRITFRKNLLIEAYKKRKINAGANSFVLNIEELATIWHFPMTSVKTPLVQKSTISNAEPPHNLPVEEMVIVPPKKTKVFKGFETDSGAFIRDEDVRLG